MSTSSLDEVRGTAGNGRGRDVHAPAACEQRHHAAGRCELGTLTAIRLETHRSEATAHLRSEGKSRGEGATAAVRRERRASVTTPWSHPSRPMALTSQPSAGPRFDASAQKAKHLASNFSVFPSNVKPKGTQRRVCRPSNKWQRLHCSNHLRKTKALGA